MILLKSWVIRSRVIKKGISIMKTLQWLVPHLWLTCVCQRCSIFMSGHDDFVYHTGCGTSVRIQLVEISDQMREQFSVWLQQWWKCYFLCYYPGFSEIKSSSLPNSRLCNICFFIIFVALPSNSPSNVLRALWTVMLDISAAALLLILCALCFVSVWTCLCV